MTRRATFTQADLDRLIKAVRAGKRCEIPSPKVAGNTARVMGYVDGYVVMRHKGAMPFLETVGAVTKHLERMSKLADPAARGE